MTGEELIRRCVRFCNAAAEEGFILVSATGEEMAPDEWLTVYLVEHSLPTEEGAHEAITEHALADVKRDCACAL